MSLQFKLWYSIVYLINTHFPVSLLTSTLTQTSDLESTSGQDLSFLKINSIFTKLHFLEYFIRYFKSLLITMTTIFSKRKLPWTRIVSFIAVIQHFNCLIHRVVCLHLKSCYCSISCLAIAWQWIRAYNICVCKCDEPRRRALT